MFLFFVICTNRRCVVRNNRRVFVANNLQDIINDDSRLRSTTSQLHVQGINRTGVIQNQDGSGLKIFTPIDYSDIRSYLRSIKPLRSLVPSTIDWILRTLRRNQQENMGLPSTSSNTGLPNNSDGLPTYGKVFVPKEEIMKFLHQNFAMHNKPEHDVTLFVDRVYICLFCIMNNIGLRRFCRAGLTSNWIENLSENDNKIVNESNSKLRECPRYTNNQQYRRNNYSYSSPHTSTNNGSTSAYGSKATSPSSTYSSRNYATTSQLRNHDSRWHQSNAYTYRNTSSRGYDLGSNQSTMSRSHNRNTSYHNTSSSRGYGTRSNYSNASSRSSNSSSTRYNSQSNYSITDSNHNTSSRGYDHTRSSIKSTFRSTSHSGWNQESTTSTSKNDNKSGWNQESASTTTSTSNDNKSSGWNQESTMSTSTKNANKSGWNQESASTTASTSNDNKSSGWNQESTTSNSKNDNKSGWNQESAMATSTSNDSDNSGKNQYTAVKRKSSDIATSSSESKSSSTGPKKFSRWGNDDTHSRSTVSKGKPNESNAGAEQSGIPKEKDEPSFNKMLHDQIKFLKLNFFPREFPDSWSESSNSGAHVLRLRKEQVKDEALNLALNKLKQLQKEEYEGEDDDDDDDDDDDNSMMSGYESPYKDTEPQSQYISCEELKTVYNIIIDKNVLWDIGLQLTTYRDMNPREDLKLLTSRGFCPCGKLHKNWLEMNGIDKDLIGGSYCKSSQFDSVDKLIRHVSSKALANEPVHIALWQYIQKMYPKYTKKVYRKRKVRDSISLPDMSQKECFKNHSVFEVHR